MPDTAAVPPGADGAASANLRPVPGGLPGGLGMSPAPAPRVSLCFARTALGDEQVRLRQTVLPLHVARLLLLFEGPQTVEDLRRMIDEPWLPEALIELERRRLIHRIAPQRPAPRDLSFAGLRMGSGDPSLDRRRALTRIVFLRLLGSLGGDMARRIDQCRSDEDLDELMPQVDALIEAIAGRDALGQFREQTTRRS